MLPGLLNEASLAAPGIQVRIRVRSQVRTGISRGSRALAHGLLSQPCRPVSPASANTFSDFIATGVFLAGCFRHFSSSLEPVCAVCNLSHRRDRGAVGIGPVLAATTPGAGSSSLQSCRRDLLRTIRVSAAARYRWPAQTAATQGRTGTFAAAHHFSSGRGRQPHADHRHSLRHQAESRRASAQYRGVVAEQSPTRGAARLNGDSRQHEAALTSCDRRRARS